MLRMLSHRVDIRLPDKADIEGFHSPAQIAVTFFAHEGSVVVYCVRFGKFEVQITMCNFQARALTKETNIGRGAFGNVRTERSQGRTLVVKRQSFKNMPKLERWELANRLEIEIVVLEVTIAKICSLFKIGPQLDL